MPKQRSTWFVLLGIVIAFIALGFWILQNIFPAQKVLRIGVGPKGEAGHTLILEISEVIARHKPNLALEIVFTDGSSENITKLNNGELDLALATADTPSVASASLVARLFQSYFHIVTFQNRGIRSIQHLRGKDVALPMEGSRAMQNFWAMASHYGLRLNSMKWFPGTQEEAVASLLSGETDAAFIHAPLRDPVLLKLVEETSYSYSPAIELVPVDQAPAIILRRPFLDEGQIPKGTYGGEPAQPSRTIPTMLVNTYLIAAKSLPSPLIYELSEVLFEQQLDLTIRSSLLSEVSHPSQADQVLFPLHPGAEAYFQRNEPSFIQENAEPLALFVTVFTMLMTFGLALQRRFSADQKNRADRYNVILLRLVDRIDNCVAVEDLVPIRVEMGDILQQVIRDLDTDQISEDGFQSFSLTWDAVRSILRDRRDELQG